MTRPLISLGDALRACHHLEPQDEETADAILGLLRLRAGEATPAPSGVGAWQPSSTESVASTRRRQSDPRREYKAPARAPVPRLAEVPAPAVAGSSALRRLGETRAVFQPPEWLAEGEDLGALDPRRPPPPPDALFGRVHRRGLLSSAIGTLEPEGELDVDAIVDVLAAGGALRHLPRQLSPTTRRGVQVLLDRGPGMDPFAGDQEQVVRALDDILADDRLEVREFVGCPGRGIVPDLAEESEEDLVPWQPPAPGTPILAITDLGIGGPRLDEERATVAEWLELARRLRSQGHLLIALVPYEATRWPPRVARAMTLLHWSEQTSVGEVRRAMRDARQRLKP